MRELRFLWKYCKRYGMHYLLGIMTLLVVDVLNLYIPQITGDITDGLQKHTITMDGIWRGAGVILLLGLGIALGRFFWRYFFFGTARKIERDLRNDMFGHLETLSMRYFNENKTGDLMSRFTNDLNAVRAAVGPAVITSFDATAMLVMVLVKMVFYVNFRLTVIAMIPLFLIAIGEIYYGKKSNELFYKKQEAFSELSDGVQENVSGIRVVKAFVQEEKECRAFREINRKNQRANLKLAGLQAIFMPLLDLLIGISSMLTLLYGGYLALTGGITLGQFVAFNQYIGMIVWPILAAGESITLISQGLASVRRIEEIFDEKPDIVDSDADESITSLTGEITLRNLTFAYPDQSEEDVLEHIDVQVEAGSTLGIIGHTGSGKSTVVNLLLRLYDTGRDMILIDGHPLKKIPLNVLRSCIAYVPQDNFLFSDTLENNITMGVDNATKEDIYRAAKNACIHSNIIEFPKGYGTIVGERGVTLSGGQKQRSSIARALLKDAPILILDDALSAVDTNTEEEILKNLRENRKNKTTIMIAHRISTIQAADHILVLEEGKKAEYGTHEELLKQGGIYYTIFEKQQLEKKLNET